MIEKQEEQIADRDWYLEATVEIVEDCDASNVLGYHHDFKAGERVQMARWGRAGRPVSTSWWSSYDIDAAFIILDESVRIIQVNRALAPTAE